MKTIKPTVRIHNGRKLYQFTPQQIDDMKNAKITADYGHGGIHPLSANGIQFGHTANKMKTGPKGAMVN